MWYVVEIIFAERLTNSQESTICEASDVLFEAVSAIEACDKAKAWADEHIIESQIQILGISAAWKLDEGRPKDGTEIGGNFFEENDPWGRRHELIPPLAELTAVKWEQNANIPIKDVLTEDELARVVDILDRIHDGDER